MRIRASGVCHSDWNAVDGTSETVCPAVLGHEGAGVVEAVGDGVDACRPRRPRRSLLDSLVRDLRGVRTRASAAVLDCVAGHGHRRVDGRHAAAFPERRARLPLLVSLDDGGRVRRARALVHPDRRRHSIRGGGARRLRGIDGRGRGLAHRRGAGGRSRGDRRLRRRRPVRAVGRCGRRSRSDRRRRRGPAEARGRPLVRGYRRGRVAGECGGDRRSRARSVGRRRRLRDRGDRAGRGDGDSLPLDPEARWPC